MLQRLLMMSSDQLFRLVLQQLTLRGSLKQAWSNNKGGILARVAERGKDCTEETQTEIIANLKSAVCMSAENLAESLLVNSGTSQVQVI